MTLDEMQQKIQSMMSDKRYRHSLGVMDTAKKLAEVWHANTEKAALAGLLHDCAKDIPHAELEQRLATLNIPVDPITARAPQLWHAIVGAYMLKDTFGVDDPEIFDAVRYHTTGRGQMSLLEKIIYVSDSIEPTREYEGRQERYDLAMHDLNRAFLACVDHSIMSVLSKGRSSHPDSLTARNELLAVLGEQS